MWNSMMKESSLGKIPVAFNGQATATASRQIRDITLVITTTQSSLFFTQKTPALWSRWHSKPLLPLCSEELEADLQIRNETVASSKRPHLAWSQVQITDESLITRWFTTPTAGRGCSSFLDCQLPNYWCLTAGKAARKQAPFPVLKGQNSYGGGGTDGRTRTIQKNHMWTIMLSSSFHQRGEICRLWGKKKKVTRFTCRED